ncbi:MAG: dynamin family protein [Chitinispirillia bacterium]|nr:dynamin family protein [Chitinispirillia bacterium]
MAIQQKTATTESEPLSFDETVRRALAFCDTLPADFAQYRAQLAELQTRLSGGRLHFAVLGQFNRGKSTFINALLGMKALPASVLPLTSVPTVIEYGPRQQCKIRFTDGKADLIDDGSVEHMETTLRQYVAEESNPKNVFCVRDATVTCNSDLLINGTALIDTPGFGSTHLHNTQTTLDLLIECDAAIFLLSADPPMTQTEMDFLRHVKDRVPKLYFILNKVDLLTPEGLSEVDRFIRNILTKDLGFPPDTSLYHTSAIKGYEEGSGLDAVRSEVLDFMIREKYFTLSEALHEKYAEATAAIKALLEKKLNALQAPISGAKDEIGGISGAIHYLDLEAETQLKKCAAEKGEFNAKSAAWTDENLESYNMSMKKALDALLTDKYFPSEAATVASTLLPKHADDLGSQLLSTILDMANKSIRSLALRHALTLTKLQKKYSGQPADAAQKPTDPEALANRLEISTAGIRAAFDSAAFPQPQPQVMDVFRKKYDRFEAIREFYEPLCAEAIAKNVDTAVKQAKALADAAWESMRQTIAAGYREITDNLAQMQGEKQGGLDRAQEDASEEIMFLKYKLRELKALA